MRRLVFPLGESTKAEVRAEAVARALPGAGKGESQELCFVGGAHRHAEFVEARANGRIRPGPILDENGQVVGGHGGVHHFTIGQRKGLGVALGVPAFVTRIDAETAAVHLGGASALESRGALLRDVVLSPGVRPPFAARARVRYRHDGAPATVIAAGDDVELRFDEPVRAVTPGQVAVLYEGDRVVGGGVIARPTC